MNLTTVTGRNRSASLNCLIPSDLSAVEEVCQAARELLQQAGQSRHAFTVDLLLREFINNAIIHGNCREVTRRVKVLVQIRREWIVLRITDEGAGFDWRAVNNGIPDAAATSGRGLAIGAQYAHRMQFSESGRQVTLWVKTTSTPENRS